MVSAERPTTSSLGAALFSTCYILCQIKDIFTSILQRIKWSSPSFSTKDVLYKKHVLRIALVNNKFLWNDNDQVEVEVSCEWCLPSYLWRLTTERVSITAQRQCVITEQTLLFVLGLIQGDNEKRTCFLFWMQIRTNTVAKQTNSRCTECIVGVGWKQAVSVELRPAAGWSLLSSPTVKPHAAGSGCTCTTVIGYNWRS